jgi:hypothetical protein
MKNKLITGLILLACLQGFAQSAETEIIPKNYIGINLSGNYSANAVNSGKQTLLNLNAAPFYGYRVKNFVFALGLGVGYNFNKFPYSSIAYGPGIYRTEKAIELLILPTIRYYSKFNLFLTGSFNIGKGFGDSHTPFIDGRSVNYRNLDYTSNIIGGSVGIGYAIKAGKSFLIEPLISVQRIYNKSDYNFNTTNPNIYLPSYNYNSNTVYLNLYFGLGSTYRF